MFRFVSACIACIGTIQKMGLILRQITAATLPFCTFFNFFLAGIANLSIFALRNAKVAQLVEHDLAKVGVASSNLVFRSNPFHPKEGICF